jgi:glyoxylase-like metal-dependent hydrolase (beta-lactamase superfamily II)
MNIFQAAQAGNLARVKELVEKDPAAVNANAPGNQSVLLIAAGSGKREVAEYLIGLGADVSAETNFHLRPLHAACASDGPVELVQLLVEKGADVNAVAKYSGKPLDLALEVGNAGIISYLKSKGAEPTPLTFETFRLAPALHRIAYPWGMRNNVIVFSGPEGILLIDSGFTKLAVPELKKTIGGLAAGDIKLLINSHPHGDHVEANSVAPAEAKILNFKNLDGPEFKDRISRSDKPFWKDGDRELAAPYLLPFNGETIQIIPNPGLHSAEDILVYFPKSKVLGLGDLLLAGTCPAVQNPIAYLSFLDNVLAAFPDGTTFASGHGPDLSKAGLKKYRDDMAAMIAIVRKNREAGKSADDMVRDDILKAYKAEYSFLDWIGPDSLIRRVAAVLK